MNLPFSSGHLLALRGMPPTSFGPYVSVWHRSPEGAWSICVDGPALETACPRYWGPALEQAALTDIDVTWTGPNELSVDVTEPRIEWRISMTSSPFLRGLNAMSGSPPPWALKLRPLVTVQEWIAKRLVGIGDIRLSFTTPSGHEAIAVPEELFFIDDAEAVLDGCSLGEPVELETSPMINDFPLPTRPTFALAQAHMQIVDPNEYEQWRSRVRTASTDLAPHPEGARWNARE